MSSRRSPRSTPGCRRKAGITAPSCGKRLGKLALLTHGAWKRFIGETRVASGEPKSATHFQALRAHILLAIMRRDLGGRWDRQMVPQGAPAWAGLSEKPPEDIAHFAKE